MWRDIDPRAPERERPEPGRGQGWWQTEMESEAVSDDPRDVFTRDLDLPRGSSRERVRANDREYRLSGDDVRVLATVGAFRVVPAGDLREPNPRTPTRPARDLERLRDLGLVQTDSVRRRAHADDAGDAHGRRARRSRRSATARRRQRSSGVLCRHHQTSRAGPRLQGLQRVHEGRRAPGRAGRTRPPRRSRRGAEARVSAVPAGREPSAPRTGRDAGRAVRSSGPMGPGAPAAVRGRTRSVP